MDTENRSLDPATALRMQASNIRREFEHANMQAREKLNDAMRCFKICDRLRADLNNCERAVEVLEGRKPYSSTPANPLNAVYVVESANRPD